MKSSVKAQPADVPIVRRATGNLTNGTFLNLNEIISRNFTTITGNNNVSGPGGAVFDLKDITYNQLRTLISHENRF